MVCTAGARVANSESAVVVGFLFLQCFVSTFTKVRIVKVISKRCLEFFDKNNTILPPEDNTSHREYHFLKETEHRIAHKLDEELRRNEEVGTVIAIEEPVVADLMFNHHLLWTGIATSTSHSILSLNGRENRIIADSPGSKRPAQGRGRYNKAVKASSLR